MHVSDLKINQGALMNANLIDPLQNACKESVTLSFLEQA